MDKQQFEQQYPNPFFTTVELARMAKVTPGYIRQLCWNGEIKAQHIGRDWAISATEVMRFLRERENK